MTLPRASLMVALALAAASAAAWWRLAQGGKLLPGPSLLAGGPAIGLSIAMAAAALAYLFALRADDEPLTRRHLSLAILVHLAAAPTPPFTSTDALMNLAFGRELQRGLNPYRDPPAALPPDDPYRNGLDWPGSVNAWGPLTVHLARTVTATEDRWQALVGFKLQMLVASLAAVALAWAHCRRRSGSSRHFFTFACNPLLAWELSGQAHNDALLVLCAVGFVWASFRRNASLALLLLIVGTTTKYGLAAALGLYAVFLGRSTPEALVAGALAGLAAVGALWAPFLNETGFLQGLGVAALPSTARVVNAPSSLALFAEAHTGLPLFEAWITAAWLILAVLAIHYARRARTLPDVIHDSVRFTLLYQILVMPSFWPWYATWPLALSLGATDERVRINAAVFAALAPALYLTGAAGGVSILVVHGTGLALWLRANRQL